TVEEETDPNALPNDFVGLKYKNGTEKAIWSYWQALHVIPEFPVVWFTLTSLMLATLVAILLYRTRPKCLTNI
ncbi:MAG: hypothetical protein ACPLW5_05660, partial [Candidatus Bathyarchaeales archaeon]